MLFSLCLSRPGSNTEKRTSRRLAADLEKQVSATPAPAGPPWVISPSARGEHPYRNEGGAAAENYLSCIRRKLNSAQNRADSHLCNHFC